MEKIGIIKEISASSLKKYDADKKNFVKAVKAAAYLVKKLKNTMSIIPGRAYNRIWTIQKSNDDINFHMPIFHIAIVDSKGCVFQKQVKKGC